MNLIEERRKKMYQLKNENPYLNIMIYGPPGVGKTWLTSTAQNHPKMRDVYYLNVEGGLATISSRGDIKAINIIGIERFKPTADKPALRPHESTLEDEFWKLAAREGEYASINTVVIDSGTEIQTLNLEILAFEGVKKNKMRTPDELWIEDYGKSTAQLKRIFRWFRDLPMNVIITALPQSIYPKGEANKSKQTEPIEVRPQFTDKLGTSLMGYVDFVWYMYKDKEERYLLTQEHGVFRAKTRGIKFAEKIGPTILVKKESSPGHKGIDLAGIYELYLNTEQTQGEN